MNGASLRHWVARALIEVNGAPSAHLLRTGLSLALYPVSMPASPIQNYLDGLLARLAPLSAGRVADYIPELQLANPDWFGICIATHDGHVYEVGDARQPFTIQSISKPLSYGLALEQQGEAAVLARIGVEPSGDAFNAISLHPRTGTPLNPLINAGAIATCGLVRGRSAAEKMAISWTPSRVMPGASSTSTNASTVRKAKPATATAPSAGCCAISVSWRTTPPPRWKPISSSAPSG